MRANKAQNGLVLIMCMILLCVCAALAVSFAAMSDTNTQLASNQHTDNTALNSAFCGMECGKYIVTNTLSYLPSTAINYVTPTQLTQTWNTLCSRVQVLRVGGQTVGPATRLSDNSGDQIITPAINFGQTGTSFKIRFYRYDSEPNTIHLEGIGTDGSVTRRAGIRMLITKDNKVLEYAVAGRGRMWLTGDSTIEGDIFSSWHRPEISPFNMTADSNVNGTINTVLTKAQIEAHHPYYEDYQLEILDEDGHPNSNPQILGNNKGINYEQQDMNMPGMNIADYDTTGYKTGLATIPSSSNTVYEYFPHAAGNYNLPKDSGSLKRKRYIYDHQTFTNASLPSNRNALFQNCTFNGVLYVDCAQSGSSYYNNVRFDNCNFNGAIVTNTPQTFKWQYNCLYFTGAATFNNQSSVQEATILAPHFNVNLGNTNPEQSDNNVLTGAIVGGIVDVRGNAQINGTIISMCDTTQWSSGYVTNIGATLGDGGSETTEVGDVGTIVIVPEKNKMLPSGITSPIVIKPLQDTYSEVL